MSEPTGQWSAPGAGGQPPACPAPLTGPGPYPGPAAGPVPGPPPGYAAWQSGPVWGDPRPPETKPGVVPLRPLGLGELLDGALAVVRGYPRPALGASAVIALVTTVVNTVATLSLFRGLAGLSSETLEGPDALSALGDVAANAAGGLTLAVVVTLVASLVLTGCIAALCGRAVLGQPMTVAQMWGEVRPRLGALLAAGVVATALPVLVLVAGTGVAALLSITGGLPGGLVGFLLLFPLSVALAVWLYVRFSLATAVVVLERAGLRTALHRSTLLVRGSWWRIFGVLLLTIVIASFVGQILQLPFSFIGGNPFTAEVPGTATLVAQQIGAGLAAVVVGPFSAGVSALLYIDRRMRAEGLDVALTAAAAVPRS